MRFIHLILEEEMYFKFKKAKDALELKTGKLMSWNDFVIHLFGLKGGAKCN